MDIDTRITEIENALNKIKKPGQIQLYPGIKILNVDGFIDSHLTVLKSNGMKGIWEVFYLRLIRLKELLKINDE